MPSKAEARQVPIKAGTTTLVSKPTMGTWELLENRDYTLRDNIEAAIDAAREVGSIVTINTGDMVYVVVETTGTDKASVDKVIREGRPFSK